MHTPHGLVTLAGSAPPPPPGVVAAIVASTLGVFVALVVLRRSGVRAARRRLDAWAAANRYDLVAARVVAYGRGPFARAPRWQTVFAVRVREPAGAERGAWVNFGNVFARGFGDADVRWDEPPTAS